MRALPSLVTVADFYRRQGYTVVTNPTSGDLPPFASTFRVELVARRGDEGVLVMVKPTRRDVADVADAPLYAEQTGSHPGWRFDLIVLGGDDPAGSDEGPAGTADRDAVGRSTTQAEQLIDTEYARLAVVAAWGAFETASRGHLRELGPLVARDTRPAEIPRELYSAGLLTYDELGAASAGYQLMNKVVHGRVPSVPDTAAEYAAVVRKLAAAARRLSGEPMTVA